MIFLACFFFPIALYCLILGGLNRRPHAVLVRGQWDCLGLLLASSGLILLGGPALLSALYHNEVRDFLLGRLAKARLDFGDLFARWWHIWLLYYLVVLAGSGVLVWWRSAFTAIYNVEPLALDDILAQVLDRMGLEWVRMGNRVLVGFRRESREKALSRADQPVALGAHSESSRPPDAADGFRSFGSRPGQSAVLDVDPFHATRHVTLSWQSATPRLRSDIETELAVELAAASAPDNPAGAWFMIAASILFFLIFLSVAVLLMVEILARKGR